MARYSTKEKARTLLRDAIIALCRETIPYKDEIAVEGLLGITIDQKDTWLVTIHEMIGGGHSKKRRPSEDSSLGFTVKAVEGNSSMYFNTDSGSEGEKRAAPKRKYRSANCAAVKAKQARLLNGSTKTVNVKSSMPQQVDIMGETVDIKQEKPDSESDEADDTGNWELCVDQAQVSNDDVLANEVLEMSVENLRKFSSTQTKPVHGRLSSKIRLHEFSEECQDHRPHLIPPTARRSHPQKRCRVCYRQGLRKESRYCCPVCRGYPGLCVLPCFELYHADKSYQSSTNIGLGFNFQELDPMFDIAQVLGLRQKANHMIVQQDSMGRRTVLSTAQTQALVENEYVGPDDDLYLSPVDRQSIKSELDDNDPYDAEVTSDTEGQDEEERWRVQEEKEINEKIKMLVSDVRSGGISTSGRLTLQEVTEAQVEEDGQKESSSDEAKDEHEGQNAIETNNMATNIIKTVPETSREVLETTTVVPASSNESKKALPYIPSSSDTTIMVKILPSSGNETPKALAYVPTSDRKSTKTILPESISNATTKPVEIVPASKSRTTTARKNMHGTRSKSKNPANIVPASNTTLPDAVRDFLTRPQVADKKTVTTSSIQSGASISSSKVASPIKRKSPPAVPKVVPAVQTSTGDANIAIPAPSLSGTQLPMSVVSATAKSPTAAADNAILLPSGALLKGAKGATTIRLPSVGSSAKTYMITKSASGMIKKTPIILKTMPMGAQMSAVPVSGVTTMATFTAPTTTIHKAGKKQPSHASPSTDMDYAIDFVPTPTSLNTQVLKVMVGQSSPGPAK